MQQIIKNISKFYGFTFLCGVFISVLCFIQMPQQTDISLIPNFDKIVHFTMYFALSTTFILESLIVYSKPGKNNIKFYIIAFLLSAAFGWLIEIFQGMLDYRSKDVFDWLADIAGSFSACTLIGLIRLAFR